MAPTTVYQFFLAATVAVVITITLAVNAEAAPYFGSPGTPNVFGFEVAQPKISGGYRALSLYPLASGFPWWERLEKGKKIGLANNKVPETNSAAEPAFSKASELAAAELAKSRTQNSDKRTQSQRAGRPEDYMLLRKIRGCCWSSPVEQVRNQCDPDLDEKSCQRQMFLRSLAEAAKALAAEADSALKDSSSRLLASSAAEANSRIKRKANKKKEWEYLLRFFEHNQNQG